MPITYRRCIILITTANTKAMNKALIVPVLMVTSLLGSLIWITSLEDQAKLAQCQKQGNSYNACWTRVYKP